MQIAHNMQAMNAARMQKQNKTSADKETERLSSGYRINRSADDAAGLSISEKMRAQIRGLNRGTKNTEDGANLLQVADGALNEMHDILNRMTELSVQSANDVNTFADRAQIQEEIDALKEELDRIVYDTRIMGCRPLLDGAVSAGGGAASGYLTKLTGCDVFNDGRFLMNIEGAVFPLAGIVDKSNSHPLITVKDAMGNTKEFRLNDMSVPNLTRTLVSNDPVNNLFVYSYDDGDFKFNIKSHWEILEKKTVDEVKSYYNYSYEFENLSGKDLSIDMSIIMDMIVGVPSASTPRLDGTECPGGYRYSGSNIPNKLSFDHIFSSGLGDQNINVEAVFTGPDIANPPDVVLSGNWNDVRIPSNLTGPDGKFSSTTGDYFYTMGWKDRPLADGGTYKINGLLGVSAPLVPAEPVSTGKSQLWIQTGDKNGDGFLIPLCDARTENLGISDLDVTTWANASAAIADIDAAREVLSEFRTNFGAWYNRMEKVISINQNTAENVSAAESGIRDTQMAQTMVSYAQYNILSEVSQAMLAQAKQSPERVLELLQ